MTTKRGRKSAADLSVVRLTDARVAPPSHLSEAEAEEWRLIVDSLPADFFRPADVPLLGAFCVASAFYKEAADMIRREGIVLEADNGRRYPHPAKDILTSQASALAQMSVKLRLAPSSRYSEKQAATRSAAPVAKPWEFTGTE